MSLPAPVVDREREERGGSLNLSIQPLFYIERKSLMISAAHHGVSDLSTRNQWKWIQIQEMECASFSAEEISNKPCGLSTDQSSTAWPLMSRKMVTMVGQSALVGTSIVPRANERAIEAPSAVVISDPCPAGSSPPPLFTSPSSP